MESLIKDTIKKSRMPARLDFLQSGTGLVLGLFMWIHMCLIGSIIFGRHAFYSIAKIMEGSFLSSTGEGFPFLVAFAGIVLFTIFVIHAALAIRKFPITWQQYKTLNSHVTMLNHEDTTLWRRQYITGFIMFFLGSAHLIIIITHPIIDPYISADRVISNSMWPLYLVLLIAVEVHGTVGLYRLCVKWGWFDGKDPKATRAKLKLWEKRLSTFLIIVGILSLLAFAKIGIEHKSNYGQHYIPAVSADK